MRVFLDTKSNRLRVELAQGEVRRTYVGGGDKPGDPKIELDVGQGGEVLAVRCDALDEVLEELKLVEKKPQA